MIDKLRRLVDPEASVHLQFASTPGFLLGRAMFRTPRLVLIHVQADTMPLRSALKEFSSQFPDVPVLAIADTPDHGFAVDLVKLGVSAYFTFPEERRKISDQIALFYNEWEARRKKEQFVEIQQEVYDFRHIIGNSPLLRETMERAQKVIKNTTMTVLITGETGTGKELFARAIHYNGKAKSSPFVDIACSALPESLLESELFGYEKGAFTDAKERKIGLFELAGDGTIFLDEVGDISRGTQSKLLKVIEDRTMRRVGGIRDIPVRARIIAATSADLNAKMQSGEFRKDLFHRLKILPLELPPLRDRKDDIPLLVQQFLKSFNASYTKKIKGITHQAIQLLVEHDWEGNVRELKHSIERAVLLEDGEWITEDDFELDLSQRRSSSPTKHARQPDATTSLEKDTMMLLIPSGKRSLTEVQRMYVMRVLEHAGGNKLKAARLLKISRPRLDRLLRKDGGGDDG
jgi:DNA-binding NtrC family response regulator